MACDETIAFVITVMLVILPPCVLQATGTFSDHWVSNSTCENIGLHTACCQSSSNESQCVDFELRASVAAMQTFAAVVMLCSVIGTCCSICSVSFADCDDWDDCDCSKPWYTQCCKVWFGLNAFAGCCGTLLYPVAGLVSFSACMMLVPRYSGHGYTFGYSYGLCITAGLLVILICAGLISLVVYSNQKSYTPPSSPRPRANPRAQTHDQSPAQTRDQPYDLPRKPRSKPRQPRVQPSPVVSPSYIPQPRPVVSVKGEDSIPYSFHQPSPVVSPSYIPQTRPVVHDNGGNSIPYSYHQPGPLVPYASHPGTGYDYDYFHKQQAMTNVQQAEMRATDRNNYRDVVPSTSASHPLAKNGHDYSCQQQEVVHVEQDEVAVTDHETGVSYFLKKVKMSAMIKKIYHKNDSH